MDTRFSDSTLYINLKAIRDNYLSLKAKAPGAETAAVVKANAYGLGMAEVSKALKKAGCQIFFVATLDEAVELRSLLSSPRRRGSISRVKNMDSRLRGNDDVEILVFNGVRINQEKIFHEHKITPVLNTIDETESWTKFCRKIGKKSPAALYVDTGINRLGLSMKEVENHAATLNKNLNIKYLMSHLACADTPDNPKNCEQLKNFNCIRKYFPDAKKSLANSAGIFLDKGYHFDLTRPGIGLYDGQNPVVSLKAKIIQIREVDRRETVGYGATASVKKGARLATVPVGYADGYLRSLSNRGHCFVDGKKAPIIGRVSMDLITLDVTEIKGLHIGQEVELIGGNLRLDEVAGQAGTINYEILTRLGQRFNREYLEK